MDIERLSDIQHKIWAHFMHYLISEYWSDGGIRVDKTRVAGWLDQSNTQYEDLSEEDKEKDRAIVRKFYSFGEFTE